MSRRFRNSTKFFNMSESGQFLDYLRSKEIKVSEPKEQLGGNSKLFRFELDGKKYVLKVYAGDKERTKRSRERELESIRFLRSEGFSRVPKVNLELSPEDGVCLEFLAGKNPKMNRRTNSVIWRVFKDLKMIYLKSPDFRDAVDASFSTSDVLIQIDLRLQKRELGEISKIQSALEKLKMLEPLKFPDSSLTYSFSDVGSHNMIVYFGRYWFLDLEFFGRDSAVKMINDYLLHPKNVFSDKTFSRSIEVAENSFGINRELLLKSTPFFAAKWATIVAKRLKRDLPISAKLDVENRFNHYLELAQLSDVESISEKLIELR